MLHGGRINMVLQKYQIPPPETYRSGIDAKTVEAHERQHKILLTSLSTNEQAVDESGNSSTRTILLKPLSRGYTMAKSLNI
jgi:hypothetical protein